MTCHLCSEPAVSKRGHCKAHHREFLLRRREREREMRNARKVAGKCIVCKGQIADRSVSRCEECLGKMASFQRGDGYSQ